MRDSVSFGGAGRRLDEGAVGCALAVALYMKRYAARPWVDSDDAQRGQLRRDTTAKLIAIEPVTGRGGASFGALIASTASPKRKRRPRPSVRSVRRFGAHGSAVAARSSMAAGAHEVSSGGHSQTRSTDMTVDS
ncbi:hypothetical protein [Burkholderia contaminans]|uniref:hypothetical protein n=1 Tax=Burkholderia contaminans TaxID=488447 RepID=UPI0015829176|nr:hypothetical protein [Burkholderia contaminans]MBY4813746.1 hypothetical protein [Burkholderia contaminans]MBY4825837.1 hypothetical protein [Burkholderia contaminans]MBY4919740.1 hypothetical protein [Burkholderia contaminans]